MSKFNLLKNFTKIKIPFIILMTLTFLCNRSLGLKYHYPLLLYFVTSISSSLGQEPSVCLHDHLFLYKRSTSKKICTENLIEGQSKGGLLSTSSMALNFDKEFTNLQKSGLLNNSNILIKNKENVEKILSQIFKGSFDDLQLVVDFDYTLTRGRFNGDKSLCSWGILDNSEHMPSFYRDRASELLAKYYPIEIDANMIESEKIPHMVEWYKNIVELLKTCSLSKEILSDMVTNSNIRLRDNTDKLFEKLKEESVPTLIFSAGMGDILEHVLWHFNLYSENVKVVSNFFRYDDKGIMIGFSGDLIHMFNKNENAIHSSEYFSQNVKKRNNVILMGDSLGDVKMAVGVPKSSNVLKIGFYNYNSIGERINEYMDAYDIVTVSDQTMDIVNAILNQIPR